MIDEDGKRLWDRVCDSVRNWRKNMTPDQFRAEYETNWSYEPSTLDLHGMTVQEAYGAVRQFLSTTSHKDVTIITGLSGQIREEFPEWIALHGRVRHSTILNGGGAFHLRLK